MSTPQADPKKIRLRNVRLSFPVLFKPKAMEEGKEPRYGANFLVAKSDNKTVRDIKAACEFAISEKWPKGRPKTLKTCFKDASEKEYEGYDENHMVLVTSSTRRPAVVNRDLAPVTEGDGVFYPGCYVNATVRVFAFEHPVGGKGISCELLAVQFAKDGESLGGFRPVNVEEEFEVLGEDDQDNAGNDLL